MKNSIKIPRILPVTCHTDHVGPETTFVAVKGDRQRGSEYISLALQRGARTIVVEEDEQIDDQLLKSYGAHIVRVENARKALAQMSAAAWSYPAQRLKIIGITGTKGKTTTTHLIKHILQESGYTVACLSSVGNNIADHFFPARLTTEHPDYLHAFFSACVEMKIEWVVMEVAAQAVSLHRTWGILFDYLVFTNFSYEHAEFYSDQQTYFEAKAALVGQLKPSGRLIINGDDNQIARLKNEQALVYGLSQAWPVHGKLSSRRKACLELEIICGQRSMHIAMENLLGEYNAYNLLAGVACASLLEIPFTSIEKSLISFDGVPGRLRKYILPGNVLAFIDYAHNPASFKAVLTTLRPWTDHLIVVFGAGGDRDSGKRPLMGALAGEFADYIILTSDNPRSEDPLTIVRHIQDGIAQEHMHKVFIELDRTAAIHKAYAQAKPGTIIALLGKGAEEYQLVGTSRHYFNEARILESLGA